MIAIEKEEEDATNENVLDKHKNEAYQSETLAYNDQNIARNKESNSTIPDNKVIDASPSITKLNKITGIDLTSDQKNESLIVAVEKNNEENNLSTVSVDRINTAADHSNYQIAKLGRIPLSISSKRSTASDISAELLSGIINVSPVYCGRSEKGWAFGLYANPQFVFCSSPYDQIMEYPGYTRSIFTNGFGAIISYRYRNFEFYSGIEYTKVAYSPRYVPDYLENDDAVLHIANISGDLMSLPIGLRYHFNNDKRFSFYVSSGLVMSTALYTDYEIHRTENGLSSLINDLRSNPSYQLTKLSKKDYEPGLLEGGDMANSLMVGLELGIGIEYQLNEQWSLFMEPGFQYDITSGGFGPNHDILHHANIKAGVKGMLN